MSTPIGMNGVKRLANDNAKILTFTANTAVTKTMGLNPKKAHDFFLSGAGPADITYQVTSDDHQAVSQGTAVYGAAKTFTAVPAAGGYATGLPGGCTAVKVTHTKSGAGTDDPAIVANMGGRFQARFAEKEPGTGLQADPDNGAFGDYVALT